jgi:hypothetical protein
MRPNLLLQHRHYRCPERDFAALACELATAEEIGGHQCTAGARLSAAHRLSLAAQPRSLSAVAATRVAARLHRLLSLSSGCGTSPNPSITSSRTSIKSPRHLSSALPRRFPLFAGAALLLVRTRLGEGTDLGVHRLLCCWSGTAAVFPFYSISPVRTMGRGKGGKIAMCT